MHTFIKVHGDYYLASSVQKYINIYNKEFFNKPVKKSHQALFNKGCMYIDKTTKKPVPKSFHDVFTIKSNTNIEAILLLFYTESDLRKRKPLKIPRITRHSLRTVYGGGDGAVNLNYIDTDWRRNVYKYKDNNDQNQYIIKIAKNHDYSCAYEDEAMIYKSLGVRNDIVKYFNKGLGNQISINNNNDGDIVVAIPPQDIPYAECSYIVLEYAKDYHDFYDFITDTCYRVTPMRDGIRSCLVVFNEIMNTIHKYNQSHGFFHGDLHGRNVKVKKEYESVKVKLFDFDFSGIVKLSDNSVSNYISSNMMIYNLKLNDKPLFKESISNTGGPQKNGCRKIEINGGIQNTDLSAFMYVFDYFRLLFSTILHFVQIYVEDSANNSKHIKLKELIDILKNNNSVISMNNDLYTHIVTWYEKNTTVRWKECFKRDYFCNMIYNPASNVGQNPHQPPSATKSQPEKTLSYQLNHLKEILSSGDISSFSSS